MEEWKEVRMSDIIEDISMGPFGSDIKRECYVDDGVPYLNGSNVQGIKLGEKSFIYVSEEKAKSLKKSIAHRGDLIVTHRGTLGQIVYVPDDSKYNEYLISNSQFRITLKKEIVSPVFLAYYFHSREGQNKILANSSQVGVPALGRPTSTFRQITIKIPSLQKQNKIVSILKSLDDKIENNRKINENLEQQAQALFKSWFVDFEPFRDQPFVESELGMIPEGWRVVSLSSIADFINGLAMQNYRPTNGEKGMPVLKIKELGQGGFDANSEYCSPTMVDDKYHIHNGDIVFSWSGTLMVKIWCGEECGLNQHLFNVVPKGFSKWFAYQWTNYHLDNFIRIAKDKAVTMGHIKRGELDKAMVLIPNENDMVKMDYIMNPIYHKIVLGATESRRLFHLRDTLLPKLMSGEIKL